MKTILGNITYYIQLIVKKLKTDHFGEGMDYILKLEEEQICDTISGN